MTRRRPPDTMRPCMVELIERAVIEIKRAHERGPGTGNRWGPCCRFHASRGSKRGGPHNHTVKILTLAVFLLFGGTASAQTSIVTCGAWGQRNDLWTCAELKEVARSSPSCDLPELLAASRAWAQILGPAHWAVRGEWASMQWTVRQKLPGLWRVSDPIHVEARWRRAIEACGP